MLPVRKSQNWLPSLFNDFFGSEWIENRSAAMPAVNIIENENEFRVEVAVPGLTKDDFKVKVDHNDQLHISFEEKHESSESLAHPKEFLPPPISDKKHGNGERDRKGNYLRCEFSYSSFHRTMRLPDNANKDEISAKVENGVLNIVIPKVKGENEAKTERLIDVK